VPDDPPAPDEPPKPAPEKAKPDDAKPAEAAPDAPVELPEARVVSDAVPVADTEIPKTRKHVTAPGVDLEPATATGIGPVGMSPDSRDSAISLASIHAFPDDGPLATSVRRADHLLGLAEQGVLFGLLAAIVLTAATATLSDKLFHYAVGRWWFTVVRDGTFAVAMFGAVIATQQQRHLAMDLVSRQLPPRGRLVLGVILKLFVIAIMMLLFRSGLAQRDTVGESGDQFISDQTIVTTMPLAAALIMVHSVLHLLIDVDYLRRNKLPPERMRSGH
jgi:TRAP-type mannitol/chloroaromatic compound transport system permease small subunit